MAASIQLIIHPETGNFIVLRTTHEISSFPFLSFFLFFFMSYERRFQSEEIYISRRRGIFLSRPFFPLFNYSRLFPVKFFRFHILYFLRKKLGGISFSPTNQRLDLLTFVYRHEQGVERKASFTIVTNLSTRAFPTRPGHRCRRFLAEESSFSLYC